MKVALAVLMALALTGCGASMPRKPERVDIPVSTPCLGAKPARPTATFGAGQYPGEKAAAQAALQDAIAWEKYADNLEVAMAGCR